MTPVPPSPFVVSDETGEIFDVVPVKAAAVVVISSSMAGDQPDDAAARVEQAMVAAINNANAAGVTDPDEVRELMLGARDSCRAAMHNEMRDLRSQRGY